MYLAFVVLRHTKKKMYIMNQREPTKKKRIVFNVQKLIKLKLHHRINLANLKLLAISYSSRALIQMNINTS